MEKTIPPHHTRKDRLFQLLLEIPSGKVVSYAELARVLETSPRAVAAMLASNRKQDEFPCFRVVSKTGAVSWYNLGAKEKLRRLSADGVVSDSWKISEAFFYRFPRE